MSDNLPTSPPAGFEAPPAPPSDPSGAATPASSGSPPADTGTQATGQPQTSAADLALEALLANPEPADNQPQTPPPADPPPAAAAPAQPASEQHPATPAEGEQKPSGDHPPADADPVPTEAEKAAGTVKVDKLLRSLERRRAAIKEAESAKQELAQERQITDKVLGAFNAAGVTAQSLAPFLADLGRARTDATAQARILAQLGITAPQAQPAPPAIDLAAIKQKLESYDVDGALALLGTAAQPQQPQGGTTQQPAQPPQAKPTEPAQRPDPGQPNELVQTVALMGETLRDAFGVDEAKRLAGMIDAEAKAKIEELDALGVDVSVAHAARVWRNAKGAVLHREAERRKAPTPQQPAVRPQSHPSQSTIRPGSPAPPAKKSADELFAELQATGG